MHDSYDDTAYTRRRGYTATAIKHSLNCRGRWRQTDRASQPIAQNPTHLKIISMMKVRKKIWRLKQYSIEVLLLVKGRGGWGGQQRGGSVRRAHGGCEKQKCMQGTTTYHIARLRRHNTAQDCYGNYHSHEGGYPSTCAAVPSILDGGSAAFRFRSGGDGLIIVPNPNLQAREKRKRERQTRQTNIVYYPWFCNPDPSNKQPPIFASTTTTWKETRERTIDQTNRRDNGCAWKT